MQLEIGPLQTYPFISYHNLKTDAFNLESINSADLIWNAKCSLKCVINGQEAVIPSNTIVLLNTGDSFSCDSNNVSHIKVLRVNAEIFSPSMIFLCGFINAFGKRNSKNSTLLFFKNEQTPEIEEIFKNIEQILNDCSSMDIEKLKFNIYKLLQKALVERFIQDIRYINLFGEILSKQFNIFHNVSDYALQLNMEPKNLLRKFQKHNLKNPSEIIRAKLLLEVKLMIVYTNKSIREICFEVGFYDPAYFSRFFKKHVGVTAQSFRKQYASDLRTVKMENSTMQ